MLVASSLLINIRDGAALHESEPDAASHTPEARLTVEAVFFAAVPSLVLALFAHSTVGVYFVGGAFRMPV